MVRPGTTAHRHVSAFSVWPRSLFLNSRRRAASCTFAVRLDKTASDQRSTVETRRRGILLRESLHVLVESVAAPRCQRPRHRSAEEDQRRGTGGVRTAWRELRRACSSTSHNLPQRPRNASAASAPEQQKRPRCRGLFFDGASRTRTGDLLGAIQALSQLSYSPAAGKCSRMLGTFQTLAVFKTAPFSRPSVVGSTDEEL